jgi:hypothetical protein
LSGIDAASECQQSVGDIGADHLVVGASKVFHQRSLTGQMCGVATAEAVTTDNVHCEQISTLGPGRDARRPTNQGFALGTSGQRNNHPLTCFPLGADVVIGTVVIELLIDLAGHPEERQLTQGGEVADSEVVAQGGIDRLRRIDIAVHQPSPQRFRRHINQLNLLRLSNYGVRYSLLLPYASDLVDNIIERLEMLHVDCGDYRDPGIQQFLDVLPSLLVT